MSKRKELLLEYDRCEKSLAKARKDYQVADKKLRDFDAAIREANKTQAERDAEKQSRPCGCICGCKDPVKGSIYRGSLHFSRCGDCVSICS